MRQKCGQIGARFKEAWPQHPTLQDLIPGFSIMIPASDLRPIFFIRMPKSTLNFPELYSKEKPMSVPLWIVRLSGAQSNSHLDLVQVNSKCNGGDFIRKVKVILYTL